MTNKIYIIVNEEQEQEVLDKVYKKGKMWPSQDGRGNYWSPVRKYVEFPYVIVDCGKRLIWTNINRLTDEEIVFDGRKEERMSNKLDRTLTIFTNNGQSFMFKHVTDFNYTTTGFEFSYTGKTTGVERHAVFNNTSVAGYALSD